VNATRLTLLSLSIASLAFAQATVVTKEGTGEAAIVNKDEQKAFAEAQQNALRAAVEQAAGVKIDADTVVVNNQLVRDQVFANTSGYVKKFEVLSKKSDKGVVTVTVKADVITDNLDKDIEAARALVRRMGRPSIVIVLQEQTIPLGEKVVTSTEVMATTLTDAFKADGWEIKDPQAINKKLSLGAAATLGPTEAKEIGDLTKASFVLYGRAALRHQDPGSMLKDSQIYPVTGEYDLALAATDSEVQVTKVAGKLAMNIKELTGESLLSYERSAFVLVKARTAQIVGPVRAAVLEHFRNVQVNGLKIALSVSGLDYRAARDFKKSIEAIKGIREASDDGFDKGTAKYRVVYLGSAQEFADQVSEATFKKRKLNIESVSGNTVAVSVAK
jgi:hypothetical protein